MIKPSPCYKCEKRTDTCHGGCEDYAEFDRENKQRLAAKMKNYNALSDILETPSRKRQGRRKRK